MMEFSIVTISAFVAMLNELTKKISDSVFNRDVKKFIPLFSIGYGLILGIVAWLVKIPNFGNNIIEAAFIGLSSGAAATGYHQIGKQLTKPPDSEDTMTDAEASEDVAGVEDVDLEPVEVSDVEDTDVEDTEELTDVDMTMDEVINNDE